jgi:hypothetical protein
VEWENIHLSPELMGQEESNAIKRLEKRENLDYNTIWARWNNNQGLLDFENLLCLLFRNSRFFSTAH